MFDWPVWAVDVSIYTLVFAAWAVYGFWVQKHFPPEKGRESTVSATNTRRDPGPGRVEETQR